MNVERSRADWEKWADVLLRLDARLRVAAGARSVPRESAEADVLLERFAGLYLDPDEVRRLVDRPPGDYGVEGKPPRKGHPGGLVPLTEDVPPRSRLSRLIHALDLDPFESDVVVLAGAVDVDPKYEKIYASLQDDVTRKRPTVGLALAILCSEPFERLGRLASFGPTGRLARFGVVEVVSEAGGPAAPLPSRTLRLDAGVFRFLAGATEASPQLAAVAPSETPGTIPDAPAGLRPMLAAVKRARALDESAHVLLKGPRGVGKTVAVRALADRLHLERIAIDLGRVSEMPPAFLSALGRVIARESRMAPTLLHLVADDPAQAAAVRAEHPAVGVRERTRSHLPEESSHEGGEAAAASRGGAAWALEEFGRIVRALPNRTVVVLETTVRGASDLRVAKHVASEGYVVVTLDNPSVSARLKAWRAALDAQGIGKAIKGKDALRLAQTFRFGFSAIEAAALDAALGEGNEEAVWEAARGRAAEALGDLAERIEPHAGWDDLVVPRDLRDQLDDLVRRAQFRDRVMLEWRFAKRLGYGKGTNALFAGPPGTGKTLAAEVLAGKLGLPLFRVECSAVVSKYIGETEKNLERIFQAADECDAVLFFDEADALFSKRTEVQDAHDRYANLETAYLLQRAERHDGLVLLATNLVTNMDPAFTRRLAQVLHFTLPDQQRRLAIWRGIWPDIRLLNTDVDLEALAARFPIAGGSIKNVALGAAYLAAANPHPHRSITMANILAAMADEYRKLGKTPESVFSALDPTMAHIRLA